MLDADTVELWYALTPPLELPAVQARLRARLTEEDLARLARTAPGRFRALRTIAWVLARTVLARHGGWPPEAWRFREGPRGKPEIAGPGGAPALHFNLSHTTGLVACAVAGDEVGADVEWVGRRTDPARLARRFFAPAEAEAIESPADEDRRRRRFFELWTLKEAYLKARGEGLTRRLDGVTFDVQAGAAPLAAFAPPSADDPAAWQFFLVRPTPDHVAAVALRRPRVRPARLVVRQAIPDVHLLGTP